MSQTKVKSGLIDFTEGIDSFIEFSGGNSTVTGDLTVTGTLVGYTPTASLNISNWDTAYGWGNHASAGYLTSFDITTQTDAKYLRSDESDTMSGSLTANGVSSIGQEQAFTWQRTTGVASDVYSLNADSGSAYLYNNTTSDILMLWSEGGRVLINTTTDVGDPFNLQVNGRILQTGTEFLFSGDQDKSITVYNNRPLYLRTNDTTRVTILGNGYVGINETNPNRRLTIKGSAQTWASAPQVAFYDSYVIENSRNWAIGAVATAWGDFNIASSTTQGGEPTTPRLTISKDGNVGIGTIDPSSWKLKIESSGDGVNITTASASQALNLNSSTSNNTILRISNYNGVFYDLQNNVSDNSFSLDYNDTPRIFIKSDGSVGIGNTLPSSLLDVRGRQFVGGGTSTYVPTTGASIIARETADTFFGIHSSGYGAMVIGWDQSEDRATIAVDSGQDIAFITDMATVDGADNINGKTPKVIIKGNGTVAYSGSQTTGIYSTNYGTQEINRITIFRNFSMPGEVSWNRLYIPHFYYTGLGQGVIADITIGYHPRHASMARYYEYKLYTSVDDNNRFYAKIRTINEDDGFGWNYYTLTPGVEFHVIGNFIYIKIVGYNGYNYHRSIYIDVIGGTDQLNPAYLETNVADPGTTNLITKNGGAALS